MKRRSESEWDRLLSEQERSGKSVTGFCQGHGITVNSFNWQKQKRRQRELFVPVEVAEEPLCMKHEAELELPGGVKFRMRW